MNFISSQISKIPKLKLWSVQKHVSVKTRIIWKLVNWFSIQINWCDTSFRKFPQYIWTKCSWFKGPLSSMRQFLTTGNPFKNMKNAFYFMLNALFFWKISKFLSWRSGPVRKWLDKKVKFDFKIYDVTEWETKK